MGRNVVSKESLTEQIKSILIDRIVEGTLSSGDRLKELQIANEFGTSQAPVREAIRSLQALGYIEHKPHVGALVRRFNKKEIEEAYLVREALEGHCLILAEIDTGKLAEQLNIHLESMHKAVADTDVKAFSLADNLFHRAIVKSSGNQTMLTMWEALRMQFQVMATIVDASMPMKKLYALHSPIVAALARNHREYSARYLAAHYQEISSYWRKCN